MSWRRLLTTERLCAHSSGQQPGGRVRTAFQVDADRILFSNAFRRLQGKAQVYPLPDDDHVHTRLTHSLEVASVGRSIGNLVGDALLARHRSLRRHASFREVGDCVHAACLAHDLGNPPFGHSGEEAMRSWFRDWLELEGADADLTDLQRQDLRCFEGNAQGFRVLASRPYGGRQGGLQLTCATLAAFTKYPRGARLAADAATYKGKSTAKLGVYQAEMPLFRQVAAAAGLQARPGTVDTWRRHPLAFLVEAADDICYLILDLEDGHRIGYVPHAKYVNLLRPIIRQHENFKPSRARRQTREEQLTRAGILRAMAISVLVKQVAEAFLQREQQILLGEFDHQLTSAIASRAHLDRIEKESITLCYNAREVVQIELAGFEVMAALLRKLVPAAMDRTVPGAKKLRSMFAWLGSGETPYERLLQATDYISGMTDSYAVDLYRKLYGLSLPGRR